MRDAKHIDPAKVVLVYEDSRGFFHHQRAIDLNRYGVLVDRCTGEPMPLVRCLLR